MPYFNFSSLDGTAREARPLPSAPGHSPLGSDHYKYQPRVPRYHAGGGQWTKVAATEEPPERSREKIGDIPKQENKPPARTRQQPPVPRTPKPGPIGRAGIGGLVGLAVQVLLRELPHLIETFQQLIESFQEKHGEPDFWGRDRNTYAVTTINGENVYGVNSSHHTYTDADERRALHYRQILIEKYPDVMDTEHPSRFPNDALLHAEATVLLRAAQKNGGTLAGKTIAITASKDACGSCYTVLPYLIYELGNPIVIMTDPAGRKFMYTQFTSQPENPWG